MRRAASRETARTTSCPRAAAEAARPGSRCPRGLRAPQSSACSATKRVSLDADARRAERRGSARRAADGAADPRPRAARRGARGRGRRPPRSSSSEGASGCARRAAGPPATRSAASPPSRARLERAASAGRAARRALAQLAHRRSRRAALRGRAARGEIQIGDVHARSCTVRRCSALQHASKPARDRLGSRAVDAAPRGRCRALQRQRRVLEHARVVEGGRARVEVRVAPHRAELVGARAARRRRSRGRRRRRSRAAPATSMHALARASPPRSSPSRSGCAGAARPVRSAVPGRAAPRPRRTASAAPGGAVGSIAAHRDAAPRSPPRRSRPCRRGRRVEAVARRRSARRCAGRSCRRPRAGASRRRARRGEFSSAQSTARPPGLNSRSSGRPTGSASPDRRAGAAVAGVAELARPRPRRRGGCRCSRRGRSGTGSRRARLLRSSPSRSAPRTKLGGARRAREPAGRTSRRRSRREASRTRRARPARPAPGRHSESPLCCITSTSGSKSARSRGARGVERAPVVLDGQEHEPAGEVRVVRDGERVAAASPRRCSRAGAQRQSPCGVCAS